MISSANPRHASKGLSVDELASIELYRYMWRRGLSRHASKDSAYLKLLVGALSKLPGRDEPAILHAALHVGHGAAAVLIAHTSSLSIIDNYNGDFEHVEVQAMRSVQLDEETFAVFDDHYRIMRPDSATPPASQRHTLPLLRLSAIVILAVLLALLIFPPTDMPELDATHPVLRAGYVIGSGTIRLVNLPPRPGGDPSPDLRLIEEIFIDKPHTYFDSMHGLNMSSLRELGVEYAHQSIGAKRYELAWIIDVRTNESTEKGYRDLADALNVSRSGIALPDLIINVNKWLSKPKFNCFVLLTNLVSLPQASRFNVHFDRSTGSSKFTHYLALICGKHLKPNGPESPPLVHLHQYDELLTALEVFDSRENLKSLMSYFDSNSIAIVQALLYLQRNRQVNAQQYVWRHNFDLSIVGLDSRFDGLERAICDVVLTVRYALDLAPPSHTSWANLIVRLLSIVPDMRVPEAMFRKHVSQRETGFTDALFAEAMQQIVSLGVIAQENEELSLLELTATAVRHAMTTAQADDAYLFWVAFFTVELAPRGKNALSGAQLQMFDHFSKFEASFRPKALDILLHSLSPVDVLMRFFYVLARLHEVNNDVDHAILKYTFVLQYLNSMLLNDPCEHARLSAEFYDVVSANNISMPAAGEMKPCVPKRVLLNQYDPADPDAMSFAGVHEKLGEMYCLKANYSLAVHHFNVSLATRLELFPHDHLAVLSTFRQWGLLEARMGNMSTAREFFTLRIAFMESDRIEDKSYVDAVLDLSLFFAGLGLYNEANQQLQKAQNILEMFDGKLGITQFSFVNGVLQRDHHGRRDLALLAFTQAMNEQSGQNNIALMTTSAMHMASINESVSLLQRTVDIFHQYSLLSKTDYLFAQSLLALGRTQTKDWDFIGALASFQSALRIFADYCRSDCHAVLRAKREIAALHITIGLPSIAISMLDECVDRYERMTLEAPHMAVQIALARMDLIDAYISMNRNLDVALELWRLSSAVLTSTAGTHSVNTYRSTLQLARLLHRTGQSEDAMHTVYELMSDDTVAGLKEVYVAAQSEMGFIAHDRIHKKYTAIEAHLACEQFRLVLDIVISEPQFAELTADVLLHLARTYLLMDEEAEAFNTLLTVFEMDNLDPVWRTRAMEVSALFNLQAEVDASISIGADYPEGTLNDAIAVLQGSNLTGTAIAARLYCRAGDAYASKGKQETAAAWFEKCAELYRSMRFEGFDLERAEAYTKAKAASPAWREPNETTGEYLRTFNRAAIDYIAAVNAEPLTAKYNAVYHL